MAFETPRERTWHTLSAPDEAPLTAAREKAIRDYAATLGFKTLRGFHMRMKQQGWDYYDILDLADT